MYMQAGILCAPQVQTFTLRRILGLLTHSLPIADFITAVNWIFGPEVQEAPGLLKLAFVTYTAYMNELWALTDDGALCGELYSIPIFSRMIWDARRNMLQKARRDVLHTIDHTGLTRALMAYQPEEI
jgi:hypothetical protein